MERTISLGFTRQTFQDSVHICQIYSSDQEREDVLLKFILSGVKSHEKTCCISDKTTEAQIKEYLEKNGISLTDILLRGGFYYNIPSGVYFKNNRFDPDSMVRMIQEIHGESLKHGFHSTRIIGEMTTDVSTIQGGSRLMEYESKVSMLLKQCPISAVCQYDSAAFDGGLIMEILKVHPFMIVRGSIVHNPFYVTPEEYLMHNCGYS